MRKKQKAVSEKEKDNTDWEAYIFLLSAIQVNKGEWERIIKRKKVIRVNEELVRTQYVIMRILRTNKATNYIRGMTVTEISEQEGRNKSNTLYKHIRILQKRKLVESGVKVERANSYFINELGLELLKKYDDMEEKKNGSNNEC